MKIAVLGINYAPELTGIAVYTTAMCEHLAEAGHEVEAIVGFPYYPQWEVGGEYRGRLYTSEEINHVSVKRCYLYVPKVISSMKRIIHEASFITSSFFRALFSSRPDVLLVVSPPLGLGVAGLVLSKLKRVPLVFHVQDLQPDAAVGLGMLKDGKVARFLYKIEKLIYDGADLVTTISKSMRDKIATKGIDAGKLALFPNWSTLGDEDSDPDFDFRKELGLEDKFVFLYSGNIGKKQGLETLIDALKGVRDDNVVCVIVGDGAHVAVLKEYARQAGVANVVFHPLMPKNCLLPMLRSADVCLVIQKRVVSDIVFPSKMTNIMAAGCCSLVTAGRETELAQAVIESDSGYVAEPEDADSLRETMLKCLRADSVALKRSNAARYADVHLSRHSILKFFESVLSGVVPKD